MLHFYQLHYICSLTALHPSTTTWSLVGPQYLKNLLGTADIHPNFAKLTILFFLSSFYKKKS